MTAQNRYGNGGSRGRKQTFRDLSEDVAKRSGYVDQEAGRARRHAGAASVLGGAALGLNALKHPKAIKQAGTLVGMVRGGAQHNVSGRVVREIASSFPYASGRAAIKTNRAGAKLLAAGGLTAGGYASYANGAYAGHRAAKVAKRVYNAEDRRQRRLGMAEAGLAIASGVGLARGGKGVARTTRTLRSAQKLRPGLQGAVAATGRDLAYLGTGTGGLAGVAGVRSFAESHRGRPRD